MMDFIKVSLVFLIFTFQLYKNIIIYQQNQYIVKRYIKTLIRKNTIFPIIGVVVLSIFFVAHSDIVEVVFLAITLLVGIVIEYNKNYKIKFKFTFRMKRFYAVAVVIYVLSLIFLPLTFNVALILFSNFYVILIHGLMLPVEKYIRNRFTTKAKNKLEKSNAVVVGITGSYGKTSSKNILYDILKKSKYSLPTPASYNTPMGISITINNSLTALHEVFIAEMGAYVIGEIAENCVIAKPDIAIITSIGSAHLESFGSRDNILKGKFEIVENLKEGGIAVLNADDEMMMSYEIQNNCNVLTYSIDKESDLRAYNVCTTVDGVSFDFNIDDKKYTAKTKLLGKHNVYNILACILVARHLEIPIEDIISSIKDVNVIEHRLELRKSLDATIIDDAFNSNPVGAGEAANVLGQMDGYRVAMTPGMIELGEDEYSLNKEFAIQLSNNADYIYVVGKNRAKPFIDAFAEVNYTNYTVVANVDEGFRKFFSINKPNKILLIENDLPDIY